MLREHKTSENSIRSFIEIVASGQIAKEKLIVLNAISRIQPCTSRMLAKDTGIERSSVTRTLNGLVYASELVKEAYSAPCPVTNKTVSYYALRDYQTGNEQLELFNPIN